MSALATQTGAINLGQGFPDTDGPAVVADAAIDAIRAGHNQYPPGPGIPELRAAIADSETAADYVSRDLFRSILASEEEHIDWLETQLELVDSVGLANYQQSQIDAKG